MMKTITLSDISQEDFDAAASTVAAGIKAYNRKLDTRPGTVLRDLLVNPEAAIDSVAEGQVAECRKSSSLKTMKEAQEAGEEVDQADIESILSNFNVKPSGGRQAHGTVKIVVYDSSVSYFVSEGEVFYTIDGIEFAASSTIFATSQDVKPPESAEKVKLYQGAAGYFFLVPVVAVEAGESGNIKAGTSLTPRSVVSYYVMSESYKDFCGGSDSQTVSEAIESIPAGLSIRGFVNKTAVEGMLRDKFDSGDHPIVAVSSVGYGDIAQRRDKHNLFGVGVGGRIDVYVRNFTDVNTDTAMLEGRKVEWEDGSIGYIIDVPPGTFPGACWVKSVSDPFTKAEDEEDVLSSLAFVGENGKRTVGGDFFVGVKRTADMDGSWHDVDVSKSASEAFNTVWQGFTIALDNVPPNLLGSDSSSLDEWSETREFKVTVYNMPQAVELQEYVDRDDVRSVSTDVVVRCPILCRVSVNAVATYDPAKPVDEAQAREKIRTYINGLGFVGRLTRSDVVQILKNIGAASVEMPNDDMLSGELHDADGVRHVLSGDALDVSTIENGQTMLSENTVVFVSEQEDIQLKLTPRS